MDADAEHRARLAAVRASVSKDLSRLWRLSFDPDEVERSWARFALAAVPIVVEGYNVTAAEAGRYVEQVRRDAGLPTGTAVRPPPLDRFRLERALGYTARVGTLRGIATGRTPTAAADVALVRTLGTATRLVTEGANQAVMETVKNDPQSAGWRRVTDGDPCDWCAGQAAQGVVSGNHRFGAHDHCGCTAAPVFR